MGSYYSQKRRYIPGFLIRNYLHGLLFKVPVNWIAFFTFRNPDFIIEGNTLYADPTLKTVTSTHYPTCRSRFAL